MERYASGRLSQKEVIVPEVIGASSDSRDDGSLSANLHLLLTFLIKSFNFDAGFFNSLLVVCLNALLFHISTLLDLAVEL